MSNSSNSRIISLSFLALTLIFIFVVYWLNRPEIKLIGSWKGSSGEILTFYKDGTVTSNDGSNSFTGSYKTLDNDTLKMDLEGIVSLTGSMVGDFTIYKDSLKIDFNNGQIIQTYTRLTRYSVITR
jgi:hypothetical protein